MHAIICIYSFYKLPRLYWETHCRLRLDFVSQLNSDICYWCFCGVVVITFVSHTKGPRLETGQKQVVSLCIFAARVQRWTEASFCEIHWHMWLQSRDYYPKRVSLTSTFKYFYCNLLMAEMREVGNCLPGWPVWSFKVFYKEVSTNAQSKHELPRVRFEITAFILWDWRLPTASTGHRRSTLRSDKVGCSPWPEQSWYGICPCTTVSMQSTFEHCLGYIFKSNSLRFGDPFLVHNKCRRFETARRYERCTCCFEEK